MDNFIPYQQNDWFENYPGQTNIPTETNELPDWESMFYAPEFPDPQSTLSAPEYQQLQMEFLATIPPLSPQQTGTNAPQPMGQDIVAPNTFQQGDVFHTVPMGQIATSTNVALPVPAQTGTNWRIEPSPPLTPPRRVVRNPRGYRRSVKSCERCTIHKLKCDDNLNGCQRCATVGEECWEKDPHIRGENASSGGKQFGGSKYGAPDLVQTPRR
ncbi:hypothetical protein TrVGV298_008284 [Trichoderma virens]|nr:hypothetical protein TrVGV298_008284 [Trichoderma virens]